MSDLRRVLAADDAALSPHYAAVLEAQQKWFASTSYADKEALLRDAVQGPGPAQDFVRYFLAMRANLQSRVPFDRFVKLVDSKGLDEKGKTAHFWRALVARLWDSYISLHSVLLRSLPFPTFCLFQALFSLEVGRNFDSIFTAYRAIFSLDFGRRCTAVEAAVEGREVPHRGDPLHLPPPA